MRYLILIAALSLTACSSTPVPLTDYYLLRADAPSQSRALNPSKELGLGTVSIATYIDQPGLMLETAPGEINAARRHQWAEPLRKSLPRFMALEISVAAGQDILLDTNHTVATRIDISVDQLHGTNNGEAILVAFWRLRSEGEEDRFFQFSDTRALPVDGYAALASAEEALLRAFAKSIANSLETGAPG
jgi:uncharacterized lipoprotein YmbA